MRISVEMSLYPLEDDYAPLSLVCKIFSLDREHSRWN